MPVDLDIIPCHDPQDDSETRPLATKNLVSFPRSALAVADTSACPTGKPSSIALRKHRPWPCRG